MIIATMPFTYSIANGIAAGFIFYNVCVIVRWLQFRVLELWKGKQAARNPNLWVWESGWNVEDKDDFLPHWLMVIIGIFMVLRCRYFF